MSIKNKLFPSLLLLGLLVSCTKQLNTNLTNTNGLTINSLTGKDVFAQALVSTALDKLGANISTATDNYDYTRNWMGYWARNNGWAQSGSQVQVETFTLINSFSNGVWQSTYHNIFDYDFIIGHSSANSILPGASIVIKSMLFQDLVDQFGNIPYSQADNPSNTTPAYDQAQDIYKNLIVQIDSAITLIQASQSTVDDTSDVMFQGNKASWLQFANTIKLRILLRQVPNVYSATDPYVSGELSNVTSLGGFLPAGTDALIQPGFSDVTSQTQSPMWATYGYAPGMGSQYQEGESFCANDVMINFLQSTSDPRIGYFYSPTAAGPGTYGGNPLGNTGSTPTSTLGPGILQSPSMPALLFSASQSLFMQAEAAQRGMITGSYASLYQQGVEESFRYLGVPSYASTADNFISTSGNSNVNITTSSSPLQTILYQKWVAECELDGLEAYSDYRRTGFPVLPTPISTGAIGLPLPKRLLYPETEYTLNIANVTAQHQTSADQNTKIFWGQ